MLERALHYFTRHDAGEIFEVFDSIRPAAVSRRGGGCILAMLPVDGNKHDLNTAQLRSWPPRGASSNCTNAKLST